MVDNSEKQQIINQLKGEILELRAHSLNRWVTAVGIVMTFLTIAIPIAGYVGFNRLEKIEVVALNNANRVKEMASTAEKTIEKVRKTAENAAKKAEDAQKLVTNVNKSAAMAERQAKQAQRLSANAQENARKAQENARKAQKNAKEAESLVEQIRGHHSKAEFFIKFIEAKLTDFVREDSKSRLSAKLSKPTDANNDLSNRIKEARKSENQNIKGAIQNWKVIAKFAEEKKENTSAATAWFATGELLTKDRNFKEAIDSFDKAIRLKSDFAEAYSVRGTLKSKLGRYKEALADLDKAIELKPNYASAYTGRGLVKSSQNRYYAAISDFDKALELNPKQISSYLGRGYAQAQAGFKDKAKKSFENARDLARKEKNHTAVSLAELMLRRFSQK